MNEVTFLPIFSAGIAAVVIGMIWYSPRVFGSAWARMSGITADAAARGKKRMPLMAFIGLLASMLIAYVMNYLGIALGVFDWLSASLLGFWCWVGFVAPTTLGIVLWEQKPVKLYVLNAAYWLVTFVAMALILLYLPHFIASFFGAPVAEVF